MNGNMKNPFVGLDGFWEWMADVGKEIVGFNTPQLQTDFIEIISNKINEFRSTENGMEIFWESAVKAAEIYGDRLANPLVMAIGVMNGSGAGIAKGYIERIKKYALEENTVRPLGMKIAKLRTRCEILPCMPFRRIQIA